MSPDSLGAASLQGLVVGAPLVGARREGGHNKGRPYTMRGGNGSKWGCALVPACYFRGFSDFLLRFQSPPCVFVDIYNDLQAGRGAPLVVRHED